MSNVQCPMSNVKCPMSCPMSPLMTCNVACQSYGVKGHTELEWKPRTDLELVEVGKPNFDPVGILSAAHMGPM